MGVAFWVAGLALAPSPALAQQAETSTNTPAADSIGPRELQGFSLEGTVTRSADPPPSAQQAPPSRPPAARPVAPDRTASTTPEPRPERPAETRASATAPAPEIARPVAQASTAPRRSSITVNLPPVTGNLTPASAAAAADFPVAEPALAPQEGLSLWPWLLAAMALGAGGAFLFWRRAHPREAFAGGPRADAFVAPQPQPQTRARAPVPAPPPARPKPAPAPAGLVSTRLRPWIDLTFQPLRCIVEGERVTFEFELAMYNSGSAPARDVLIEASTFNASPTQDEELQAFFSNPVAEGERIAAIPPLKSFTLRTQVSMPRNQIRVLEAGGRHVFVPLIAFNAVYRWGSGEGQTSAAYLLGRDTKGEKMAPFRIDLGARIFRGVGQRPLPLGIRS